MAHRISWKATTDLLGSFAELANRGCRPPSDSSSPAGRRTALVRSPLRPSAEKRVIRRLLHLAERVPETGGLRTVRFTQDDLADLGQGRPRPRRRAPGGRRLPGGWGAGQCPAAQLGGDGPRRRGPPHRTPADPAGRAHPQRALVLQIPRTRAAGELDQRLAPVRLRVVAPVSAPQGGAQAAGGQRSSGWGGGSGVLRRRWRLGSPASSGRTTGARQVT